MNNNPLIIRLKEAEQQIISCVNSVMREQSLPCYLVEPIIEKVYRQVKDEAKKEYENAKYNFSKEKEGVDNEYFDADCADK